MQEDRPAANLRSTIVVRIACYLLSAIIVVLLGLAGVLIVMSLGPNPGDNMALMGVPLLGLPLVPCCLFLLCIATIGGQNLKAIERLSFIALGASFIVVFGLLYFLG